MACRSTPIQRERRRSARISTVAGTFPENAVIKVEFEGGTQALARWCGYDVHGVDFCRPATALWVCAGLFDDHYLLGNAEGWTPLGPKQLARRGSRKKLCAIAARVALVLVHPASTPRLQSSQHFDRGQHEVRRPEKFMSSS